MKILKLLVLTIFFLNLLPVPTAEAGWENVMPAWDNNWCSAPKGYWGSYWDKGTKYYPPPWYVTDTCPYVQTGYTCSRFGPKTAYWGGWNGYECIKNTYSATKSGSFTLIGNVSSDKITTVNIQMNWVAPSPFIYFYNAPEGEIDVTLDSQLDSYAPLPTFNQESGWDVTVKDSILSVNGTEVDHVFYELALNKIELTRNGRNFASKAEVIEYLQDSDFLTKLGFSQNEKDNSLGYLIPKIEETDSPYYYLTVLEEESIADTSTLSVTPAPDKIIRQYFAVYPSGVPVTITGDFVFPEVEKVEGFTVKETGEFLINSGMFVFFK